MARAGLRVLVVFLVALGLLLCRAAEAACDSCQDLSDARPSNRRKLLETGSQAEKAAWYRLADSDEQSWSEMFSVDQSTQKEMINGAVAENPWGTLCSSIAECA
mmetsp:Transcript_11655/g.29678  ORF Transcript_11655/g.29678 Transcript_11655/m.29678 type:complete len:104 (-) Transcript_11655:82-393(-)